jgi:hypothetical protein
LKVEAALIDVLGLDRLTNAVRGWRSVKYGRRDTASLRAHYSRQPVDVVDPSVLIKIPQLFREAARPLGVRGPGGGRRGAEALPVEIRGALSERPEPNCLRRDVGGTAPLRSNSSLPLRRLRRLALWDTPLQLRWPPAAARVASMARRERPFVSRKLLPQRTWRRQGGLTRLAVLKGRPWIWIGRCESEG